MSVNYFPGLALNPIFLISASLVAGLQAWVTGAQQDIKILIDM
jgi:hypothetical protein